MIKLSISTTIDHNYISSPRKKELHLTFTEDDDVQDIVDAFVNSLGVSPDKTTEYKWVRAYTKPPK